MNSRILKDEVDPLTNQPLNTIEPVSCPMSNSINIKDTYVSLTLNKFFKLPYSYVYYDLELNKELEFKKVVNFNNKHTQINLKFTLYKKPATDSYFVKVVGSEHQLTKLINMINTNTYCKYKTNKEKRDLKNLNKKQYKKVEYLTYDEKTAIEYKNKYLFNVCDIHNKLNDLNKNSELYLSMSVDSRLKAIKLTKKLIDKKRELKDFYRKEYLKAIEPEAEAEAEADIISYLNSEINYNKELNY